MALAAPLPRQRTHVPVTLAATRRSTRAVLRSPALLVSPVAQSLFFLLVYQGQLGQVGTRYLDGTTFLAFLLPLILLTGVATGAGAAGTLVLRDVTSGYLDRLRLAHGSATPFLVGTVVAVLAAVVAQAVLTVGGAALLGYRPHSWAGTAAMLALLLTLGVAIALLSVAVAIGTGDTSTTGLVPLAVFGLSFFTGVFAPVSELTGWMRVVASVNPLTPVVDAARQVAGGTAGTSLPLAAAVLACLVVAGAVGCALATRRSRRTR